MDTEGELRHIARLQNTKSERDQSLVDEKLNRLRKAALGTDNLMPYLLEAVKAYATLGETTNALKDSFGEADILNVA